MDDELYYDNGTPTTTTLPEEEMMEDDDDDTSYDSFLNQWSENEKGYVWDAIFGTLLCAAIVATCCYLSHQYRVGERAVAAEEEHRRREEINRKVEEVESKKHELAQVIHGFAISMLSIIYNGNGNGNSNDNDNDNDIDNNESRATIFHGTHEDNKENCTEKTIFVGLDLDLDLDDRCWDEEILDMEAAEQSPAIVTENSNNTNANLSTNTTTTNASIEAEPVMRFLEFDLDDDGDNDDESQMIDSEAVEQPAIVTENNNIMNTNTNTNTNTNITTTTTNSNLYVSNEGKGSEDSENDDENEECDSVPVVPIPTSLVPIPASLLLQAAENNPCAICLEDFLPSDTIIFCSNHIVVTTNNNNKKNGPQQQTTIHNTGSYTPHCFHEACSLEYMFAHTAGVQAPCPLCRKPFLCSLYADDDGTNNNHNHNHENNNNHNSNSIPHRQEEEEQQQQPQQQQQQQLATLGGDERESGSTLLFPSPPSLSVAVTHPTELMEAATSASAEAAVEAAV